MATLPLSLRIHLVEKNMTKTMQFHSADMVLDVCRKICEKHGAVNRLTDYGLFLSSDDGHEGVWLEPTRSLDYYILRNWDILEYKKKLRTLRVRMLDGTTKTLFVDESLSVLNLMAVICAKIGIANHDEYSLVRENLENDLNQEIPTLIKKKEVKDPKMYNLKKKLKIENEMNWLDPSKMLREQGVSENETVILRRKFFFSDQNIDSRDPVQLNLLYVQTRNGILDGTHPVTQEKACEFAGIQCQVQFGDNTQSSLHYNLEDLLPRNYTKTKGIEKMIVAEHRKNEGKSVLEAKDLYTKTARALKTYGVSFFLVKEKMKGKNKLIPRLLGITKKSILRLDEKTKDIIKTWPLTTVRRWGASTNTFTLDFGDYSKEYYSVKTPEADQIQKLISGYIDIIIKSKQAKDHCGILGDEGSAVIEDSVCRSKAMPTTLSHKENSVNTESVAKPALLRSGADDSRSFTTSHMESAQFTSVSGVAYFQHSTLTNLHTNEDKVLSETKQVAASTSSSSHETIISAAEELMAKVSILALECNPATRSKGNVLDNQ